MSAAESMREDARAAVHCFACGSALGARHHLAALRKLAVRSASIERHLLHSSTAAAELRRAVDAALRALDAGSPAGIVRALTRVETLTQ